MKTMLTLAFVVAGALPAAAQTPLPFADKKWAIEGERARIEAADGKDVLSLETGEATRRDVRMQDGTIDFDVQVTPRRSFVYLKFRIQSEREHEEIYLRPHKSSLPDAVQYAPVFDGRSAWQLFHGPGGTAAVTFNHGAWTHVRLVAKGRQAVLFVGDMTNPALIMPRLAREPASGYLALAGFLPANVPGSGPIARYANVTVRPDYTPFDFSSIEAPATAEPGAVREWRLSKPYVPADAGSMTLPSDLFGTDARTVTAEASGLVLLNRFIPTPPGKPSGAAARITIKAAEAGHRQFDLGFSDIATVFLNGQPLYRGDARYSFDAPRQEGLIGYGQASLYLPLRAGDNELVIVVTDVFGGWGLQGRFADMPGLTIDAR
jgi:hypothetical protein